MQLNKASSYMCSRSGFKYKTDSIDRADGLGIRQRLRQLFAQIFHVAIHSPLADIEVVVVNCVEQLAARKNTAWRCRQGTYIFVRLVRNAG